MSSTSTSAPTPGRLDIDPREMVAHAAEAAQLLKLLAHETRLLILCYLFEGELTVGQLNKRIPVSQSVLSQHLAVLRRDALIETRREAQTIFYNLSDCKAVNILATLHALFCNSENRHA